MPNLWFTVVDLSDAPTDKVSLENDKDATDLKRAIKETMPNTLADYNPAQLRLKARSHNETNDQARNLDDPEATISDVFKNYGDWVLVFLPSGMCFCSLITQINSARLAWHKVLSYTTPSLLV